MRLKNQIEYSREQVNALREVRGIMAERGYIIFDLYRRKHTSEFLAAPPNNTQFSGVIFRAFRGRIRAIFFELAFGPFAERTFLEKRFGSFLYFARKPFNPTYKLNYRMWSELVSKRQLKALV